VHSSNAITAAGSNTDSTSSSSANNPDAMLPRLCLCNTAANGQPHSTAAATKLAATLAADRAAVRRDACWADAVGPKSNGYTKSDVPHSYIRVLLVSGAFQGKPARER
jgi:hypothetical protein